MRKKCLLALLLVLSLILSGCALTTVDKEADNARVVIDVNGETVTKGQLTNAVNNVISQNQTLNQQNQYYAQMYAAMGMQVPDSMYQTYPTDSATLLPQVITAYTSQLVNLQKAKELKLDEFTEEELAHIQEDTDQSWSSYLSSIASYYFPDQKLEGEALEAEAQKYIDLYKLPNKETYMADAKEDATREVLLDKLRAETIKDVTVSDDEVKALYDEKVAADTSAYTENPAAYGTAVSNGTTVYYAPAGYRNVKHILVKLTDEDSKKIDEATTASNQAQTALTQAQTALDEAAEDADKTALQAAVDEAQKAADEAAAAVAAATDAAFESIKGKADEVYALAAAEGADFDALVKEYSEDSESAPAYYTVNEGSTLFVEPFVTGAMALEKVGDISEPVRTTYGYHIIQYFEDVAEGPVALDTVKDGLTQEALTTKQDQTYTDAMAAWKEAATIKTYPEKME